MRMIKVAINKFILVLIHAHTALSSIIFQKFVSMFSKRINVIALLQLQKDFFSPQISIS